MSDYERLVTVIKFANLSENLSPEVGIGVAAVASYLTTSTDFFTSRCTLEIKPLKSSKPD